MMRIRLLDDQTIRHHYLGHSVPVVGKVIVNYFYKSDMTRYLLRHYKDKWLLHSKTIFLQPVFSWVFNITITSITQAGSGSPSFPHSWVALLSKWLLLIGVFSFCRSLNLSQSLTYSERWHHDVKKLVLSYMRLFTFQIHILHLPIKAT